MSMWEKRMAWQRPKSWNYVQAGMKARVRWPSEALPASTKPEAQPWKEGVVTKDERHIRIDIETFPLPGLAFFEVWQEVR